ncbi:MAG: DUF4337 domain-containing protein [Planctomycetes bacterium]|nr:DUF4337 domain-containing protein [Planctomycetota bacterium]
MANTHEHLEHAEHAGHHASDPFNQRVAVSMAIVAACLAGISMVGHRTHNEVLQLLGDANRLRTEAATAEVEKSNLFAWYQSKRMREEQYKIAAKQTGFIPGTPDKARTDAIEEWTKSAENQRKPNKDHDSLPELQERGLEAGKRAEELKAQAATIREEATHVHHQADRLDIAHLLAEVALVVCSIALLTKKKLYWGVGILAAVLAISVTASAYMIPHHPHTPAPAAADTKDAHGH